MRFLFFVLLCSLFNSISHAQGPAADPDIPRHFTLQDGSVAPGEITTVPLWIEKYESAQEIRIRFEIDPTVAEYVGHVIGPDLDIIGPNGCWNVVSRSWINEINNRPVNPGWQVNTITLSNWCSVDCRDGITGSIGAYRDLGIQFRYHILDLIIQGNAAGQTPIWVDRRCIEAQPQHRSFMSWYVENICPGEFGSAGANACFANPDDPKPFEYVSLSADFLPPPELVLDDDRLNPMIYVGTTSVRRTPWSMVKELYR